MDSAHTLTNNASKTNDYSKKKKKVFTLNFSFLCFFSIFYTITKEKNKSPKILIIFPFLFCFGFWFSWTKFSFSSKFIDLWKFLYNKIFQMKDWGFQRK